MELAACEVMCGVDGAFCDGTDGESDVVDIGVGSIELALRWNLARDVQLHAARAVALVNRYRSGSS